MNLLLLGLQGSGKGEQAQRLTERLSLAYLAAGDLLRQKAKEQSEIGKLIHQIVNIEGKLLPDELTSRIVFETLEKIDWKGGIVFDGYPRNAAQFEALEKYLVSKGQKIDKVIYLKIGQETVLRRLSSRRICGNCQAVYNLVTNPPKKSGACDYCRGKLMARSDDRPEAIKERIAAYKEQTEPLIAKARENGILEEIDGEKSIETVFQEIMVRLNQ